MADKLDSEHQNDIAMWIQAVELYSNGMYREAIEVYGTVKDVSPAISYNMALAYEKLGETDSAIKCWTSAIKKDRNFAIAYFARGCINFQSKSFVASICDFKQTRVLLRGNKYINYKPLGLLYCLHEFEVLYNLAVAHIADGSLEDARRLLTEAMPDTDKIQRKLIEDAFQVIQVLSDKKSGSLQLFHVPSSRVFEPPRDVTENLQRRTSSKGSKVVFASDESDTSPSFQGIKRVEQLRLTIKQPKRDSLGRFSSLRQRISAGDLYTGPRDKRTLRRCRSTNNLKINSSGKLLRCSSLKGSFKRVLVKRRSMSIAREKHLSRNAVDDGREFTDSTVDNVNVIPTTDDLQNTVFQEHFDSIKVTPSAKQSRSKDTEKNNLVVEKDAPAACPLKDNHKALGRNTSEKRSFKRVTYKSSLRSKHVYGKPALHRSVSDGDRLRALDALESVSFYSRKHSDDISGVKDRNLPLSESEITPKNSYRSLKKVSIIDRKGEGNSFGGSDGQRSMLTDSGINIDIELAAVEEREIEYHKEEITQKEDVDVNLRNDNALKELNQSNVKETQQSLLKQNLGSVFGDNSTAVRRALTEACSVLTAFVTPVIDKAKLKGTCVQPKRKTERQPRNIRQGITFKENQSKKRDDIWGKRSTKTKRAPEPPRLTVGASLKAAGSLFTVVVNQEIHEERPNTGLNSVQTVSSKVKAVKGESQSYSLNPQQTRNLVSYTSDSEDAKTSTRTKLKDKKSSLEDSNSRSRIDEGMRGEEQVDVETESLVDTKKGSMGHTKNVTTIRVSSMPIEANDKNKSHGAKTDATNSKSTADFVDHDKLNASNINESFVNSADETLTCKSISVVENLGFDKISSELAGKHNDINKTDKISDFKVETETINKTYGNVKEKSATRKTKSARQARVPPAYPPPPLRPGYAKRREQQEKVSRGKRQKRLKSIEGALFATVNTLGAIAAAGYDLGEIATPGVFKNSENVFTFENIPNIKPESKDTIHDYVNLRNINDLNESGPEVEDGEHNYVNVSKSRAPMRKGAFRHRILAAEEENLRTVRLSEDETPKKFDGVNYPRAGKNAHIDPQTESSEILLSNGTVHTTCKLLGDFVNSSTVIQDAFKAFIQEVNNNVEWCTDGHLKVPLGEHAKEEKPHDYVNLLEISRL